MRQTGFDGARGTQTELLKMAPAGLSGVGITKRKRVFGLKVNVRSQKDRAAIPREVCGIPVHDVEVVEEVRALQVR